MKRYRKSAQAALWAAGLVVCGFGCVSTDPTTDRPGIQQRYSNLADPAWPERYLYHARREVLAPFAIQANNGHIIDQTIYSYHFEPDTDRLTPGGREKLDVINHRRPHPDPKVYLQTMQDLPYDPQKPDAFIKTREDLNGKRAQAILTYLSAQNVARPINYEVQIIDPGSILVPAEWRTGPFRGLARQFQSAIQGASGGGGGGGGGGGAGPVGPSGAGGGPAPPTTSP